MDDTERTLAAALREARVTRDVVVDSRALTRVPAMLDRWFDGRPAIVFADGNTYRAAGAEVVDHLQRDGRNPAAPFVFDATPRLKPYVSHAHHVRDILAANDCVPVAVGSGVVNDIVKHGAALAGRPYLSVPTAASVDGYAASGAPLLIDGFKRTVPCDPPLAIVVDLDVVKAAPPAMAGWGYGDLAGKTVACLDWMLADALGVEAINRGPFDMVQKNLGSWLSAPGALSRRDPGAIADLMTGLLISGFAIQAHGNSRPASGSEHQFSHLWEMEGLQIDGVAAPHGACVAVGTLAMLAVYQWLLDQDIPDGAEELALRNHEDLAAVKARVDRSFPDPRIRASAWEEARAKQVSPEQLRERIQTLRAGWASLRERLGEKLPTPAAMQARLAEAGAPSHFTHLGFLPEQFASDYARAQLIRRRFTALDLVMNLGWFDRLMGKLFGDSGFWAADELPNAG